MRALLLTGMGITLVCNVAFGFTYLMGPAGYWPFLSLMVVNGFAQSTGWPGNVGVLGNWLNREDRGRVMAVWATCYQLGSIFAKAFAAFMIAVAGAAFPSAKSGRYKEHYDMDVVGADYGCGPQGRGAECVGHAFKVENAKRQCDEDLRCRGFVWQEETVDHDKAGAHLVWRKTTVAGVTAFELKEKFGVTAYIRED